jgi:hypothetical protein
MGDFTICLPMDDGRLRCYDLPVLVRPPWPPPPPPGWPPDLGQIEYNDVVQDLSVMATVNSLLASLHDAGLAGRLQDVVREAALGAARQIPGHVAEFSIS